MSEEDIAKKLWDKLGNLYLSKSMVNKLFLQKKLYLLRMNDGDSITEHLKITQNFKELKFHMVYGKTMSLLCP